MIKESEGRDLRMIDWRRMRWVTRVRDMRNAYKVLVRKSKRKRSHARHSLDERI
jgi:hypothetical protein